MALSGVHCASCSPRRRKWKASIADRKLEISLHHGTNGDKLRMINARAAILTTRTPQLRTDYVWSTRLLSPLAGVWMPAEGHIFIQH